MSYDRITEAVLRRPVELGQYTSLAFGQRCRDACVRPSMGSVGDAYDNALCESFFATLECELLDRELLDRERLRTHADARAALFDYIEGWYNPRRRHSALGYLSPMAYERTHATGDRPLAPGSTISRERAMSVAPARRA
jgi:putative transposase